MTNAPEIVRAPRIYSAAKCSADVVFALALAEDFPSAEQIEIAIRDKFAAKESDGWIVRPVSNRSMIRLVWSTAKAIRERRNGGSAT